MRYNTKNPVEPNGSSDFRDAFDNTANLDLAANGDAEVWVDRKGRDRASLKGMENRFDASQGQRDVEFQQDQNTRDVQYQQKLASMGWSTIGDYAAGLTITTSDQVFRRDGEYWKPKPSTALPYTTTGVWASESSKFAPIGDGVLRQEMAQPDGDTLMHTRGNRTQRQKNDDQVSIADYGGTGIGDDTVAFNNAALAASGREILIPFPAVTITSASNAQGCMVRGQNTVVDGHIRNCAGLTGISIRGHRQDQVNNFMQEPGTRRKMLIRRATDAAYFVATQKVGSKSGAVVFQLLKDLSTPTNSLGGAQQLLRSGFVHNCVGVYGTRLQGATTTVGTWDTYNVPPGNLGHTAAEAWSPLVIRQSTSSNAALTYSVTVPRSGKITLAILGSSGSPSAVELSVDGVVQKTVNPQTWIGIINSITLEALPGARSIRIRNASGTGTLYFAGLNFHRLDEVDSELSYDTLAMYRSSVLPFYSKNQGAHDYAIMDYTAGLYGGSYHGGETMLSRDIVVNSVPTAMTDGQVLAADDFYIEQVTRIDWSGYGGGILEMTSTQTFRDSQCDLAVAGRAVGANPSIIRHLHTGMSGVNDDFSQLIFPRNEVLGENTYLGQCGKIVLQHPATRALAITEFNLFSGIESREGGCFINQTVGSYNKVYYAMLYEGRRQVDQIAFTCRRTFR